MKELTSLQWAKEGYILKPGAKGVERWTNCSHQKKATYFMEEQVIEDKEAAAAILASKRKEYYKARKETERKERDAARFRELMKTKWQWLQEGRIPNKDARWRSGRELNGRNGFSYGNDYCYCHFDNTHEPANQAEMDAAIEDFRKNGNSLA